MESENSIQIIESYDLASADDGAKLAPILADYIVKNNLSTKVQGKDFVNVEGWQYAGSRLALYPAWCGPRTSAPIRLFASSAA